MSCRFSVMILVVCGVVCPVQSGQGIWPTDRMLEYWLQRMATSLRDQYDLDDAQAAQVEELMVGRWMEFMKAHRKELEPLAAEFIEIQLCPEPPDAATVQSWAKGTVGVFERVRTEILEGQANIREILRPDQKMRFDKDVMKFSIGAEALRSHLQRWANGQVEEGAMWQMGQRMNGRRSRENDDEVRRSQRARQPGREQEAAPTSRPAVDQWEAYVLQFIRKHKLDDSQQTTAMSILKEIGARALAYRSRTTDELNRLEERIRTLQAPLDEMFAELMNRLDGLLIGDQRAGANENNR